jgi:hypothetical protein
MVFASKRITTIAMKAAAAYNMDCSFVGGGYKQKGPPGVSRKAFSIYFL